MLGGLLAAYHLSGEDSLYLEKAIDLADRILPVFNTPSGLPLSSVNLAERVGIPDHDNNGWVSTAEVSTLQLELRYLSLITENDAYWRAGEKVRTLSFRIWALRMIHNETRIGYGSHKNEQCHTQARDHIHEVHTHSIFFSNDQLIGTRSPDTGAFVPFDIRLGSRGDSYYEYLL